MKAVEASKKKAAAPKPRAEAPPRQQEKHRDRHRRPMMTAGQSIQQFAEHLPVEIVLGTLAALHHRLFDRHAAEDLTAEQFHETANLDPASTLRVEAVIGEFRKTHQAAVIWVSHDPAQIARVANRHLRVSGRRPRAAGRPRPGPDPGVGAPPRPGTARTALRAA